MHIISCFPEILYEIILPLPVCVSEALAEVIWNLVFLRWGISSFLCVFYRGILAIAWSMADPELLLSCGKDAKILCSNPNTGEVWGGTVSQTYSLKNILSLGE